MVRAHPPLSNYVDERKLRPVTNLLKRLFAAVRPTPKTMEDVAAEAEAKQLRDQMETVRLSQRSGSAGENYQSGRGSR